MTLLLYLDNIIDKMLDHIELVFKWLEEFNLQIKPEKCHFFQHSVVFLGYVLSPDGISANLKKVDKVKDLLVPTNPKKLQSFLWLASYYHWFIPKFATIVKCLHQLVVQQTIKKVKKKVRKINLWKTRTKKF